nr:unnamed protein product [Callosobruchus analis]
MKSSGLLVMMEHTPNRLKQRDARQKITFFVGVSQLRTSQTTLWSTFGAAIAKKGV